MSSRCCGGHAATAGARAGGRGVRAAPDLRADDPGDLGRRRSVITTGLVNMRRFEQRPTEILVLGEMLDRTVTLRETGRRPWSSTSAMEQWRTRDWVLSKVAVREGGKRFRRRGQSHVLDWTDVSGFAQVEEGQGATHLLAASTSMRPADLAGVLHELSPKRRNEIAAALDDERLADVLEELPEDDQVEILAGLDTERAADVLEEMSPDDAADLIAELPTETAERCSTLMEPDEAEDVRRLLTYEEHTAGGLMTSEPVILPPTPLWPTRSRMSATRPEPGAGRDDLRLPAATGDSDRTVHRRRPHPAAAARTAVRAGVRRTGHRSGRAAARTTACTRSASTWRPTTWWRRRCSTTRAGWSVRSPSTTYSTTCCPTTGATNRPRARPQEVDARCPVTTAAPTSRRLTRARPPTALDIPRELRRTIVRPARVRRRRVRRLSERIARFLGTGRSWST